MDHSVGNCTFQKHACVPVYIDHLEVLLLPQLKYKKHKHKHEELSSDCSFLQNANKVKKKNKQNTNYQSLWDNLLILFIQKQFLGTNQALCAKGKQWIKLTRPFAYRSYSIVLREIQLFTLFSFRYLFLIITNIKNREILKLKDSLSSGQILSTLHYTVFLYF